jgi:predicted TIM-barrel fold metal-dependent hydrolase
MKTTYVKSTFAEIAEGWDGSRRKFLNALIACGANGVLSRDSLAQSNLRLIDVHHHILPPVYLAEARDRLLAQQQGYLPARVESWSPQNSLKEMDRNGVATSIVSISTPGIWFGNVPAARTLARKCNEYAAQLVQTYSGRFGFFATVPLPDTEGSLREIAYALDVLKADGIGLLTSYGDRWPGDSAYAAVFEELNSRKAVVYFHPTGASCCRDLIPNIPSVVTELPHDTTRAITSLLASGSFARYRDIRFIFSHAGGTLPMLAVRISRYIAQIKDISGKLPNGVEYELRKLFYDTASSANAPAMAALMKVVPSSQILFGSDYPFVPVAETRDDLTHLGLSGRDLQVIGRENALKLFPRQKA